MLRRVLFSLLALTVFCSTATAGRRVVRRNVRHHSVTIHRRVVRRPVFVRSYRRTSRTFSNRTGRYGRTPFGFGYPIR